MIKYNNPRSQHDLYYWENTAEGTRSEVDYIIARDMKVLPISTSLRHIKFVLRTGLVSIQVKTKSTASLRKVLPLLNRKIVKSCAKVRKKIVIEK